MSIFRSDKMGYFSLIAARESAWEILNEIGENGCLQFVDLNSTEVGFNRPYSHYIKRCEALEDKISTIEEYMAKFDIKPRKCENPKAFLENLKTTLTARNKAERNYLDDVEGELQLRMNALAEQIRSYESLIENYNHLVEYKEVLDKTRPYIGNLNNMNIGDLPVDKNSEIYHSEYKRDIRFTYLAGVINKEDSLRFRRILFRITRGMAWTTLIDIEQPQNVNNEEQPNHFINLTTTGATAKTVFLIVYQGGEREMMKTKLARICDTFGASKYGIPEEPSALTQKVRELDGQMRDAQSILNVTRGHVETILHHFATPGNETYSYSHIEGLKLFVLKEKTLYHNLNMLQPQATLVKGNCWCPLDRVQEIIGALAELRRRKGDMASCEFKQVPIPKGMSPPTFFKTNDFTYVFQEIVNTYGIPRYREINPGLFACATFPFLFGVMFGDICHGFLLFIFGLYLIFFKSRIEKDPNSMMKAILPTRYLLALQGFFACYAGLVYNDFTSIPFNLFGTCYESQPGLDELVKKPGCNYPMGIDPHWYDTTNELTFLNSFKMKLAIVLGVTQMIFGILLRGLNNIFSKSKLDFIFEFLPMLIFMSLTFGYMVVLIFMKWATPWGDDGYDTSTAPSIIAIFIKMALSPGEWDTASGTIALYGGKDGSTQATIQLFFLLTALVCAVLILVPKPIILWYMNKKATKVHQQPSVEDYPYGDNDLQANLIDRSKGEENQLLLPNQSPPKKSMKAAEAHGGGHGHGDHFDMGEVFVHQVIEAIEFVLGTISNTASYLRLWALSLAHSQLAQVFLFHSLGYATSSGSWVMAFFTFWIFANITFGVLMLMDQMECFLHALRLHWVEFQNKFYKADGHAFAPFSFEKSLQKAN